MDWSVRLLSSLHEQNSFYTKMAMAERKSPIVFCPAIKKVADIIEQDPQTLTQFYFDVIESLRQIGLPTAENDWLWYDCYFEGNVIVTLSKENHPWMHNS